MENEISNKLRTFMEEEVIPAETEYFDQQESAGPMRAAILETLKASAKKKGLWALGHPREIGGGGLSFLEFAALNEIIGRSELGQFAVGSVSMQDSIMLQRFGSKEQRDRWLTPMVDGDIYPSVGMTEPEVAGSDPTLMESRAQFDGDEIVINAHKWFTTGANNAAFTTVFAITDPYAEKIHHRFSAILVPTNIHGYQIVRVIPTMGHTGGGHCEIRLDRVRVPKANLLGKRGEGFTIAQERLGPGRIFHCMRWLGQMQRAFELLCERAVSRVAHGTVLSEKGEIQRYVAEIAAEIHAHRLMTFDAARRIDAGEDVRVEISLIKFYGSGVLHNVIDKAIQVHGALGLTADTPLERMYREARYARLYDGPDEVHRMTAARRMLRDPETVPWAKAQN
jgi:acyl-CoA dehydrogenase